MTSDVIQNQVAEVNRPGNSGDSDLLGREDGIGTAAGLIDS